MSHSPAETTQASESRGTGPCGLPPAGTGVRNAAAVAAVWAVLVFLGFRDLTRYATTPGEGADPAALALPEGLSLERARPTLVLFAHPECPCTRATLRELERILVGARGALAARVYFSAEAARLQTAQDSQLMAEARAIEGLDVELDLDGVLARTMDVHTSGQTLMFSPEGRLEFAGGITRSRGHEGVNESEAAIAAILAGTEPAFRRAPVFGCPISTDSNHQSGGTP